MDACILDFNILTRPSLPLFGRQSTMKPLAIRLFRSVSAQHGVHLYGNTMRGQEPFVK